MTTLKPATFVIPDEVRTYAERSVEQASKAFDEFMTIARRTVSSLEEPRPSSPFTGTFINREMNRQVLTFTEENVAAAFDLARQLVRAGTVDEVVKLQSAFLTGRMSALGNQMQAIGKAAVSPIEGVATPVAHPAAPAEAAPAAEAPAASADKDGTPAA